jgi:hypothetical protein
MYLTVVSKRYGEKLKLLGDFAVIVTGGWFCRFEKRDTREFSGRD